MVTSGDVTGFSDALDKVVPFKSALSLICSRYLDCHAVVSLVA